MLNRMSFIGLAHNLRNRGLDDEVVEMLKRERVSGSQFCEMDASVLRACGFRAGQIIDILKFQDPTYTSQVQSDDDDEDEPSSADVDDALEEYFDPTHFSELGAYEKQAMYQKLMRFKDFATKNPTDAAKITLLKPDFVRLAEQQQKKSKGASESEKAPAVVSKQSVPVNTPCSSRNVSMSILGPSGSKSGSNQSAARVMPNASSSVEVNEDSESESDLNSGLALEQAVEAFEPPSPPPFSMKKADLPTFDVVDILHQELKDAIKAHQETFISLLQKGEIIERRDRLMIVHTLTRFLYTKYVKDGKSVSTAMREGMAKSLVCTFPKLAFIHSNGTEWAHIFDPAGPTGWIANASRPFMKKVPQRQSAKTKAAAAGMRGRPRPDEYDSDEVKQLALVNPGTEEKAAIMRGMEKTFRRRQRERALSMHIGFYLEKYPQFVHYDGEVIRAEFRRMFPGAEDMCQKFMQYLEKFIRLSSTSQIQLPFNDDVLKALMLISRNLPHDIPLRDDPKDLPTHANFDSMVAILKCQDDVTEYVETRQQISPGTIQPYLILQKALVEKRTVKYFLVLDFKIMELKNLSIIRAVDILIQSYFVFNVRYPLGWRNTFHFIQTSFYKIFEHINKGRKKTKDSVTPSETNLLAELDRMS